MGKKKITVKVKAEPKKKPVKPTMGKGTSGLLTARIIAKTNESKK